MAFMAFTSSLWQESSTVCRFAWLFLSENTACWEEDAHLYGTGSRRLARAESIARATS